MENNAIIVDNITKKFRVYYDKGNSLKEKILFKNRNKYENRIVLDKVNFQIKKGEAIGLIGENGCGKSTTLKLINKIIYPDSGTIFTKGRISSLIELGAGFHPDMTGRENIYTNASILGLTHNEISKRLEQIIYFSEMEEFLDNPVRTYSSGMYMRLAFSVAINVDADILLIDEILGVGDVSFQNKCFERLREIKEKGTTIVIVSHSLSQLEQICDRSIWFENGHIKEDGIPKFVHEHYLYDMEQKRIKKLEKTYQSQIKKEQAQKIQAIQTKTRQISSEFISTKDNNMEKTDVTRHTGKSISWNNSNAIRRGNQTAFFTDAFLTDKNKIPKMSFETGEDVFLHLLYKSSLPDLKANVGYAIYRNDGLYCYGTNCIFESNSPMLLKTEGHILIKMPSISLLPNKYLFDIAIQSPDGIEYDNICFAVALQISYKKRDTGICRIDNIWNME